VRGIQNPPSGEADQRGRGSDFEHRVVAADSNVNPNNGIVTAMSSDNYPAVRPAIMPDMSVGEGIRLTFPRRPDSSPAHAEW
jgi:hypothetical protein